MEMILSRHLSRRAIVTPFSIGEDVKRYIHSGVLPRRVFDNAHHERRYGSIIRRLARHGDRLAANRVDALHAEAKGMKAHTRIGSHIHLRGAQRFLRQVGQRETRYITICRRPFELLVSQAFWNIRKNPTQTLEAAIDEIAAKPHRNLRIYGLDDPDNPPRARFAMVIRLENLAADLAVLASEFGIEPVGDIPREKATTRRDHRPADEILTHKQKAAFEKTNRALFELWDNPPRP